MSAFADLNVFIKDQYGDIILPPEPIFHPNMFEPVNEGGYSTIVLSANVINNIMWGVYSSEMISLELNQQVINEDKKIP